MSSLERALLPSATPSCSSALTRVEHASSAGVNLNVERPPHCPSLTAAQSLSRCAAGRHCELLLTVGWHCDGGSLEAVVARQRQGGVQRGQGSATGGKTELQERTKRGEGLRRSWRNGLSRERGNNSDTGGGRPREGEGETRRRQSRNQRGAATPVLAPVTFRGACRGNTGATYSWLLRSLLMLLWSCADRPLDTHSLLPRSISRPAQPHSLALASTDHVDKSCEPSQCQANDGGHDANVCRDDDRGDSRRRAAEHP